MALILTSPVNAISGIPGTIIDIDVPAGNTVVVDSFPEANTRGAKWFVTVTDVTATLTRSYEVFGLNKFGVSAEHNKFSQLGDFVDHDVIVQLNAGNMELEITNNSANTLTCNVVRIQVIHS